MTTVLRRIRTRCAEEGRACTIRYCDRARHHMPMYHLADGNPKQSWVRALNVGGDDAGVKGEGGDPFRSVMIVYCPSLHNDSKFRVCIAFPAVISRNNKSGTK